MDTWEGLLSTMNRQNDVKHTTAFEVGTSWGHSESGAKGLLLVWFSPSHTLRQADAVGVHQQTPHPGEGGCTWWELRRQNLQVWGRG